MPGKDGRIATIASPYPTGSVEKPRSVKQTRKKKKRKKINSFMKKLQKNHQEIAENLMNIPPS